MFWWALAPCKCRKVFCALIVTVKTCVLRATTKKVVNFFWGKSASWPALEKNPAGAHDFQLFKFTHSGHLFYSQISWPFRENRRHTLAISVPVKLELHSLIALFPCSVVFNETTVDARAAIRSSFSWWFHHGLIYHKSRWSSTVDRRFVITDKSSLKMLLWSWSDPAAYFNDPVNCRCNVYRLQHCLEWVMRVYMSKLTPGSVVTCLFHDWARSLWLFCLVWHVRVMIKVQYSSTDS